MLFSFERYHTLAKLVINKMKKALSVLKQDVELLAIKKPRLDYDTGCKSPGVAIRIFLLYVWISICLLLQVHVGYITQELTSSHLKARNSGRQRQEEARSKLQQNA